MTSIMDITTAKPTSNTKLPEGLYIFEQPFLRAPNETVRRHFRATQKHIERDFTALKTSTRELSKKKNGDAVTVLDSMIAKVDMLQKKLVDVHEKGTSPTLAIMRKRLEHLDELDKLEETELEGWTDVRLDRWLVDWSLRNGYHQTAKVVAEERGIEDLVDLKLFAEIRRIEEALGRKSCTEALAWCSDNKNALRKNKSPLEFELRLQEYIELARAEKTNEALVYWRKHLQLWQDTHLAQIQQATGLIAFRPDTKCKSYQRLYSTARWPRLIQTFNRAIYQLHSLPSSPLLHYALSAGLTALRVPACYDKQCYNPDCPVCGTSMARDGDGDMDVIMERKDLNGGLGVLAREVPFAHHANSTIVCRITGKIMNEDNPPLAFDNGNVYSTEALEDMANKNGGIVTCPRTKEEQEFITLKKVFIS
ncbi:hypothetical protein M408DRAFT_332984 [Serendipita vermifera MAFF 305830]|uniref:CTLH domain-containing protein n=1 Tax=Serendipita vermifera MAFF 305830 TaxID=933852 RepID=A0A0C3AQF3_SERVB|nr:hypothetical protein M408DRAFT_332984 [Serendipita vermifera MAFF 305830]